MFFIFPFTETFLFFLPKHILVKVGNIFQQNLKIFLFQYKKIEVEKFNFLFGKKQQYQKSFVI